MAVRVSGISDEEIVRSEVDGERQKQRYQAPLARPRRRISSSTFLPADDPVLLGSDLASMDPQSSLTRSGAVATAPLRFVCCYETVMVLKNSGLPSGPTLYRPYDFSVVSPFASNP